MRIESFINRVHEYIKTLKNVKELDEKLIAEYEFENDFDKFDDGEVVKSIKKEKRIQEQHLLLLDYEITSDVLKVNEFFSSVNQVIKLTEQLKSKHSNSAEITKIIAKEKENINKYDINEMKEILKYLNNIFKTNKKLFEEYKLNSMSISSIISLINGLKNKNNTKRISFNNPKIINDINNLDAKITELELSFTKEKNSLNFSKEKLEYFNEEIKKATLEVNELESKIINPTFTYKFDETFLNNDSVENEILGNKMSDKIIKMSEEYKNLIEKSEKEPGNLNISYPKIPIKSNINDFVFTDDNQINEKKLQFVETENQVSDETIKLSDEYKNVTKKFKEEPDNLNISYAKIPLKNNINDYVFVYEKEINNDYKNKEKKTEYFSNYTMKGSKLDNIERYGVDFKSKVTQPVNKIEFSNKKSTLKNVKSYLSKLKNKPCKDFNNNKTIDNNEITNNAKHI